MTGLSIGYRTKESHRDQKSGVRLLTQVELLEVSLVTFPANGHARVSSVKRFYGGGAAAENSLLRTVADKKPRAASLSKPSKKPHLTQGDIDLARRINERATALAELIFIL